MYVDMEHKNWDEILPYGTFAYNMFSYTIQHTAQQETMRMTSFRLLPDCDVTNMLDAMLPHEHGCNGVKTDADYITQRTEEARQLACVCIRWQQEYDAGHYNLRHREFSYEPGERIWV